MNGGSVVRHNLLNKIERLFDIICSGDDKSCSNPTCKFFKSCHKIDFAKNPPKKNLRLKGVIKSLNSYVTKKKGRKNPNDEGGTFHERIKFILGISIFEHELIKGHTPSIISCQKATTLSQIVNILEKRSVEINKKSMLWHYHPKYFYRRGMMKINPHSNTYTK